MTKKEFIQKIDSGEAKVLTIEAANLLKGHRIAWMYFGYEGNEDVVEEMVVGDIFSEFDYNKTQPFEGYTSRAAYWMSCMTAAKLAETKERLLLTNAEGESTHIFCEPKSPLYDEPTFCCSDVDREVYYIEL